MTDIIDIHTHFVVPNTRQIVNRFVDDNIPNEGMFSLGLHPWKIEPTNIANILKEIEEKIELKKNIVAIGECGIDRAIMIPINIQKQVFKAHISLAEKYKRPLIIHCVKAYSDMLEVLKESKPALPWIFHGYNSNNIIARQLTDRGCYISFGKGLLTSAKNQQVFKNLPLRNVFLETDESHEKIENIYKKAAELHHICIDNLKEQIYNNFIRVFGNIWRSFG